MLGRDADAHTTPHQVTNLFPDVMSVSLERQCLMRWECYVSSLRITLVVCMHGCAGARVGGPLGMGADKRDAEECVTPSCVAPAVFSILEGAITAW